MTQYATRPAGSRCASKIALCALLLPAAAPVPAAVFCVENATQLQAALDTAATNDQADEIGLAVGTYDGPFTYEADILETAPVGLELIGGFVKVGGFCQPASNDPRDTVLFVSSGASPALMIDVERGSTTAPATIHLERMTLETPYSGLDVAMTVANGGNRVEVVGNVFRATLLPLDVEVNGNTQVFVTNNLVANNGVPSDPSPIPARLALHDTAAATMQHNTIVNNETFSSFGALTVSCSGAGVLRFRDNIVRGNSGIDVQVNPACTFQAACNDVGVLDGTPDTSVNLLDVDPMFVSTAAEDYRLAFGSPLIDAACALYAGQVATDILGVSRTASGPLPDLGAFEASWIFADGFESGNLSAWSAKIP